MATKSRNAMMVDDPFATDDENTDPMGFPTEDPDDAVLRNATAFMGNGSGDDDFSFEISAEEMQPQVPPTGTYNCIAVSYEVKEGQKGKYVTIGWRILDPEWKNKRVWSNHSSSVGAQAITAQQMENIGVPFTEVADPVTGEFRRKYAVNRANILNKLARIKVEQGTYNGRPTANVKGVNPPNEATRQLAQSDPDLVSV